MGYWAIKDKLARGDAVLVDGGIGTEILRRGVYWRCHGLEQHPEVVAQVHADYRAAGAEVLKTDTFQLNRRAYLNLFHGIEHMRRIGPQGLEHKAGLLTRQAVALARQAANGSAGSGGSPHPARPPGQAGEATTQAGQASQAAQPTPAVAGVISPLEHCFRPDLSPPAAQCRAEYDELVGDMKAAGADFILFESMNRVEEARTAAEAARDAGLPVWVSFVVRNDGNILGHEPLAEAVKALEPLGVDVIAVNCAPLDDITRAVAELRRHRTGPIGAWAHIGRYDPPSWKFGFYPRFSGAEAVPPARYLEAAREWKRIGAQVIGGCCGTTPEHIRALRHGVGM
ncbi:MAG TPA: homocysteine S-methyltransferase family protein [Terriglobia bacterium]|nr:homocysteine S-methyltransferase family protein [Terriglobia bacterium]